MEYNGLAFIEKPLGRFQENSFTSLTFLERRDTSRTVGRSVW